MTFIATPVLLALVATASPQGTLQDARVRIALAAESAQVIARYRITDAGDSVRFTAIRLKSQSLAFDRTFRDPRLRLDTLSGSFRITAGGRGRAMALELRCTVRGDLSRIPLFVPEAPTQPGRSRVVILVDGVRADRLARFVVPRFTRDPGGVWRAAPDHLPSVVALVKPERGLPIPALAQWSVLLVGIGGTLAWLMIQVAARRRP